MKKLFTAALLTALSVTAFGQVGINTETPHASSDLELGSSDKALYLNRVANTGVIANPQNGMVIYDLEDECIKAYQGDPGAWSDCLTGGSGSGGGSGNGEITTATFIGPLTYVATPRAGYEAVATTPDGKWSVRMFVPQGNQFSTTSPQLRYNGSESDAATRAIFANVARFATDVLASTTNNSMNMPKNAWAGYSGVNTTTVTAQNSSNFPYWFYNNIYGGSSTTAGSRVLSYTWTEADSAVKTFYTVDIMVTTTIMSQTANVTNCPDGTCNITKAYISIKQFSAP